jgi:vitamin B12 transporter
MRPIVAILLAGLLGGGLPAMAQTSQTPQATQQAAPPQGPQNEPVPVFRDSVVVSASLDAEEREDVPASVTVLGREEIAARQANTLSDLVTTVPGLAVVQAGPPGQQTSLFTRGTESDQTLLLWNGIQLNDPFFGGANWQFIPVDGVERVEVVRGPFSALYGSNAVGGVIQVLTGTRQGGTVTLEGGDWGYARAGIAAGGDLGRARVDVTGHVRRGGGELANDFFDSEEGVARALWPLGPSSSLGLLARADDSETGIPLSGSQPTLHRRITWREREVAVPFRGGRGPWEVEAQISRTKFDGAFRDPDDPFGFTASDTESEALRGRTVVSRHSGSWRTSFGADAERLEVTNSSSFGTNLDGAHQRTRAAFGQAGWERGPVHLDLGVRRDDNDVYGGETSLRAGGVVKLAPGLLLRASYGEAFRAPSLGELFFPGSGNPDLQPEDGESWEVGLERTAGDWRLALTGFENRLRNLIDFDFATFRDVNVGRSRSRGVEGELGFRHGPWNAALNGTWLDSEDLDTGLELLRRPKQSANLVLTARPGPWTLSLVTRYVGNRADVDPVTFQRATNPSYTRIDVAARWHALPWLSPYARLENAADETYSAALGFPSPGRTLIGGVALEF